MQGPQSVSARIAWVSVAALAVFVLWIATPASANAGVAFLYTIPIGLAAWWGGARTAAGAVAGCLALYVVGTLFQPVPDFGLALVLRALVFSGVAALVSALRGRVDVLEHSAEELEDIRAALTPAEVVDLANVDAATAFVPSDHGVSGDFYLLTNGPDGSTIAIVGDVTGHGPEAARLATFVRARLAAFAANTSDPAEILSLANLALTDDPRPDHELVSAVCLRFEPEGAGLSWAVAGHPSPLRLPGLVELRPPGSTLVLGARADLDLHAGRTILDAQEGVLVYTDGATDVRRDGRLLGLDGLRRLIEPFSALPADPLISRAEDAILEWANEPLRDDICLLMMRPARAAPISSSSR